MYTKSNHLSRALWSLPLFILALGSLTTPGLTTPFETPTPSRLSIPIVGGNIAVDYMGSAAVPESRITWLVQIADRSTCTTTPVTLSCDGFMTPGDRVVVGDNYMAFMDLTRVSGGWGGGGGGVFRGLWMLITDGTGSKNFKYISNAFNHAPNNLFPYQDVPAVIPGQSMAGAAHELLFVPTGATDPEGTFRASESATVSLVTDGFYNPAYGWQHYHYHYMGEMTQGNGTGAYPFNTNAGTPARPSKVMYHLYYWFFNNSYSSGNESSFQIQVRASIEVCSASATCYETQPIDTIVSTMGFTNDQGIDSIRLDNFKPVSQEMRAGNYSLMNGACVNNNAAYSVGSVYPITGDTKYWATALGTQPFQLKMKSDPGDTLTGFRINVNRSTVGTTGIDLTNKVFHQMIYDEPLHDIAYDVKFGGLCGAIGTLQPGHGLFSQYYLGINYLTP